MGLNYVISIKNPNSIIIFTYLLITFRYDDVRTREHLEIAALIDLRFLGHSFDESELKRIQNNINKLEVCNI